MSEPTFHVVVMGATGFTGKLVAAHLLREYGEEGPVRWAMAGRNESKLAAVRDELGAKAVPLLVADSHDPQALKALVRQSRVVCSTVGPFAKHGDALVEACAEAGTHYCDITGETQWIRRMIDRYQDVAAGSGARLVHCCGFDSIPSDLGTWFLHRQMSAAGKPPLEVRLQVRRIAGGASGGTVASIFNVLDEARGDRDLRRLLARPYSLNPDPSWRGPDGRDQQGPLLDDWSERWTAPFVMAAVNTRVVRRSNALMDFAYGEDFRYSESVATGRGWRGRARAYSVSASLGLGFAGAAMPLTRPLVSRMFPDPGEGPSPEEQLSGSFDLALTGQAADGTRMTARVTGDRDPGYGSTSRMLGEAAVCLASDELDVAGGSWTPASAMGQSLIDRLQARAGLSFQME